VQSTCRPLIALGTVAAFVFVLSGAAVAAPHHPLSDIYPMDVPLDLDGQPIEDSTGAVALGDTLNMTGNEIIDYISDARSTAPGNPSAGQMWFDTGQGVLKYYNGTTWVITASADQISSDLQSVLDAGNSAGSYDIDMSGQEIRNIKPRVHVLDSGAGAEPQLSLLNVQEGFFGNISADNSRIQFEAAGTRGFSITDTGNVNIPNGRLRVSPGRVQINNKAYDGQTTLAFLNQTKATFRLISEQNDELVLYSYDNGGNFIGRVMSWQQNGTTNVVGGNLNMNQNRINNAGTIQGKNLLATDHTVTAANPSDPSRYGYFEARNTTSGKRAFYLGWGNPNTGKVDFQLDQANELDFQGGTLDMNQNRIINIDDLEINSGDDRIEIGPNAAYGRDLWLGGWGSSTSEAWIRASNGNLHLDSQSGDEIYMNWYTNNPTRFGGAIDANTNDIYDVNDLYNMETYNFNNNELGSYNGRCDDSGSGVTGHGLFWYDRSDGGDPTLFLCGQGSAWEINSASASSIEFKENVTNLNVSTSNVLGLNPVSFTWKDRKRWKNRTDIGIIAEQAEEKVPKLVTYRNGSAFGFRYDKLSVYLLDIAKEQQKTIKELEKENRELEKKVGRLETAFCNQNPESTYCIDR